MSLHFSTVFKCDQKGCHEEWSGLVRLGINAWDKTIISVKGPKQWTIYTTSSPFDAFSMEKFSIRLSELEKYKIKCKNCHDQDRSKEVVNV